MKKKVAIILVVLLSPCLYAQKKNMFEQVLSSLSGVNFKNSLTESPKLNVLTYEYFYNGGGVAIGDINNDGLEDIYFSANMKPNALFLNLGNFKFREITTPAGLLCESGWKTGVTMADVNGDGLLDIYVCYSGKGDPEKRRNKLFINNGNLTFTEKAKEFGLDDPGYSTQASFFDFDRDGDLDMFLVNHNVVVIREFEYAKAKEMRHPYAGDKLFRNDNGHFVDVSAAAGIKGNPLSFGLGISVADINRDGWLDMYVSNDYVEPDYLYINNHDGTFTDRMTEYMQHISYFSMGVDVNDINNDGKPDIFTVDMLPEDNKRQKLLYGPENYEHYALMVLNGFYFQNMRNMLHLNNGDGTYSEIGQFSGISKTDWSWAPLLADYDNDGRKDIFITNGYYKDYTNRDFLKYKGDYYFQKGKAGEKADTFQIFNSMKSTPVHDYIYKNNGDLTFTDKSEEWGFAEKNFSNGAAYADLDNDGDLDLVVNNENSTASIYKNQTREQYPNGNFLQLKLSGIGKNTRAIGAKIKVYQQGKIQYFEQVPTRGFQSCVSDRIHIGLGATERIDSIKITWMSGLEKTLKDVGVNRLLDIKEDDKEDRMPAKMKSTPAPFFSKVSSMINYGHVEEGYNDFKRQPLLLSMLTTCGPVMAKGDVNMDGREDVFIGGAQANSGKLFIQNSNGGFDESLSIALDNTFTDADALFLDVDGDQDIDLYIVSGGYNEYTDADKALQDRLYLNDGTGKFSLAINSLPEMKVSKSCIAASDFDHDGDMDVFVGGRVIPGKYPVIPESFLLQNNGGHFQNVSAPMAPNLPRIGMVTDAEWLDVNGDGWDDLVVMGEFMPIEIFLNNEGKRFDQSTANYFDQPLRGLWTHMAVFDFDHDGDKDIVAGNFGLNTQLRASQQEPLALVYKDFDKNGSIDPILTYYVQGKSYPFASRDELLDQMYTMRSKFTSYDAYSEVQLTDIFKATDLKDAEVREATTLETVYLENKQNKFVVHTLPQQAQFSPAYAITPIDYNHDGNMDIVMAGNQSSIRIRVGVIDANFGQLFAGDGKGNFTYVPQTESGLSITGDVKSLQTIKINKDSYLLIGINNVGVQMYKLSR